MTEEMKVFLISKVEEYASITLSELKTAIHNEFNTSACTSTVKNWLDGELFTVKNVRAMVSNMNNQLNKLKRSDYMTKLFHEKSEGRRIIVWIDETNFNLFNKRREGRSRIGSRASLIVPASKGANLHRIGAMTSTAVILFCTRRGAFKSGDCITWFEELIIGACEQQGITDPTFVIDNAPAHCRLQELIQQHPHVHLLRLAPYSFLLGKPN